MISNRDYIDFEDIFPSIHIDFKTGNKLVDVNYYRIPEELQEFAFFLLSDFMKNLKIENIIHDYYMTNYKGKDIREGEDDERF